MCDGPTKAADPHTSAFMRESELIDKMQNRMSLDTETAGAGSGAEDIGSFYGRSKEPSMRTKILRYEDQLLRARREVDRKLALIQRAIALTESTEVQMAIEALDIVKELKL